MLFECDRVAPLLCAVGSQYSLDVTQEGTDSRQCPSGEVAAAYLADGRSLNYWSASDTEAARASASVDQYESVSTGLGLHHIAVAVNVCDMSAELWQEDAYVHFRLRMDSEVSHCISTERDSTANTGNIAPRFPPNLHVVCIDDSPIARKAFESILPQEIAGSVVQVFGETLADVAEYKHWSRSNIALHRGAVRYCNC